MLQTSTVYYYLILFHMMSSVLQGIMFVTLFRLLQIFGPKRVPTGSHDEKTRNPKKGSHKI